MMDIKMQAMHIAQWLFHSAVTKFKFGYRNEPNSYVLFHCQNSVIDVCDIIIV